jgi:hypothetical protein
VVELKVVGVKAPRRGYQARTHYEQRLQAWLAGGTSRAFALWGLGGSGQTTLARKFAATDAALPLRLVFLLSASTMDQDYLKLLSPSSRVVCGGGDSSSHSAKLSRSQGKIRLRVRHLLSSPPVRGHWLAVLDDLQSPAQVPMEEAGLDWLYDAFQWTCGKSVITKRASAWAKGAS